MNQNEPPEMIRSGSPFKTDPEATAAVFVEVQSSRNSTPEVIYDVGPLRYTAMGSVAAAVMVMGFAAAAALWFPAGGTLIAALGCLLSIFGLYSPIPMWSAGCLVVHAALFLLCYARAIAA
jgi:hypothetical protein